MTIGVAIIGYGLAGRRLHAPLIAADPRLRIARVVTSRTDEVAEDWPDAIVGATADEVVADPAVDLVVIATPNRTHASLAEAALAAGKHVVVDKPIATRADEGGRLIERARMADRMLTVFHNRRWDGDFLTVQRLMAEGALGEVMLAELRWDRFRAAVKPGWREAAGAGGGLLNDLGPHLIDQALQLFGVPDDVTADIVNQRGAEQDDYFELTLRYGMRRVILSASTLAAAPRPRFALHGTRGSFVKHGLDPQEAVLRAGGRPGDAGYGEDAAADYGVLTTEAGARPIPTARGDWRLFYRGVADAILEGAPPPVDPQDAVAGLRIIEAARERCWTTGTLNSTSRPFD